MEIWIKMQDISVEKVLSEMVLGLTVFWLAKTWSSRAFFRASSITRGSLYILLRPGL